MTLDISAFQHQADWCQKLGSPFNAAVLLALIDLLDDTTQTGRTVCNWPGTAGPLKDVVPLRLTGALHALVLAGKCPDLAAIYPPNPMPGAETLSKCLGQTLAQHDADIVDFLQHAPQTNEVARASVLLAGLSTIAQQTNQPLALFEIGASGGLNLNLDRFSCQMGPSHLGDPDSTVTLAPSWQGSAPTHMPNIAARHGCDLNPIHITDETQATRLLSYIWPDQPDRLSRTRAAIALARQNPPKIGAADAADWVELNMPMPRSGQTRVLMHSIAWQYMPDTVQTRITRAMETAGQSASAHSPLAWLSFELSPQGTADLRLRLWPHAPDWQTLAHSNPHVKTVNWVVAD